MTAVSKSASIVPSQSSSSGAYTAERPVEVPIDQLLEPRYCGVARTSGKAVASLVLGITSLPLTLLTAVPALIIGYRALSEISVSQGRLKGRGWAWGGIILGWVGVALMPFGLAIVAVGEVREAAARMRAANNMRQLALAMHNYHDSNDRFPTAYTLVDSRKGQALEPGVSWRVEIMPYVEAGPVYSWFDHKEAWDGPTNLRLAQMPIKVYQLRDDTSTPPNQTHYQVFLTAPQSGQRSMFNAQDHFGEKVSLGHMERLQSNVILIAEAPTAVPWTAPWDMTFDSNAPPQLGRAFRAGSLACMVPGNVEIVPHDTDPEVLKRRISRDLFPDERNDAPHEQN
jgi:hypothetical protein